MMKALRGVLNRAHWLFLLALLILYVGWGFYAVINDRPLDFYVYYVTARIFLKGYNVYEVSKAFWKATVAELKIPRCAWPYRYPPLTAFLITPLSLLPPRMAAIVWVIISSLAFLGAGWWLGRSLNIHYGLILALGLELFFVPPLTTLYAGQINALMVAGLALFLWAFQSGKQKLAAAGLAFSILLKLVPFPLFLYICWRREWRIALYTFLFMLILLLITVPLVGWDGIWSYFHKALSLSEPDKLFPYPPNQSLQGFFARLLSKHQFGPAIINRPGLALSFGRWTAIFITLITILICIPLGTSSHFLPLEFSLICISLQLIPPFAWYHQLVMLLFPFAFLAKQMIEERNRLWKLFLLILCYVLT